MPRSASNPCLPFASCTMPRNRRNKKDKGSAVPTSSASPYPAAGQRPCATSTQPNHAAACGPSSPDAAGKAEHMGDQRKPQLPTAQERGATSPRQVADVGRGLLMAECSVEAPAPSSGGDLNGEQWDLILAKLVQGGGGTSPRRDA
eukprot:TRINITY_DN69976_c0_g1_i1.p1 TRINITY_DN69976_c0_g1~~TRINITY_DN69976_c0_g1_i1.p1  ORF type:complete len:146 (+),score=14.20 TRINITY_DN69976_c0_g1_i1:34-471(+)